jgi:hypothetical protein
MGKCIVSISNKMQRHTVYLYIETALHVSGGTSTHHNNVHHRTVHKEKSNKMQQCINTLLFPIYMKLNMFRVTHRPSSGA